MYIQHNNIYWSQFFESGFEISVIFWVRVNSSHSKKKEAPPLSTVHHPSNHAQRRTFQWFFYKLHALYVRNEEKETR